MTDSFQGINVALKREEQFKYLPNGTFLKGAALGYDALLADILWIRGIGYFADQYHEKGNYFWLFRLLEAAVELDPKYIEPYEFGGIVLANEIGDIKHSTILLKRGMENVSRDNPRYWYLPFFLAFNYWYHENDYSQGAEYLSVAASFPQAPAYLPMLTARMYADADNAATALPFLDEMIKSAESDERRDALLKRKKEVLVNYHLDILDQSIKKYHDLYKKYPNNLNELVSTGIMREIPDEPFGGRYFIDLNSFKAKSTKSERIKVFERKI